MPGTLQRGLNDRRKTFQRVGEPAAQPLHFAWSSQPTNGREVRRAEKLSGTLQEDGGGQATRIDAVIAIAGGMDVSIDGLVGGAVDSPSPRLSQKDDAMVCFGLLFGGLGPQERVAGTGCRNGMQERDARAVVGGEVADFRQGEACRGQGCRNGGKVDAGLRCAPAPLYGYRSCRRRRSSAPF